MGINKDKEFDVSDSYVAQKYKREILPKMSYKDIQLTKNLINEKGYYIQFLFQLSGMDRKDAKVLSPIIEKYIGMFERKEINNSLIVDLGVKGNNISTDFLIKEFRKPNDYESGLGDWNKSRRWAASNALLQIQDKSKLDEYIEIVENDDTCNDSYYIIMLLGKIKNKKSLQCLIGLLKSSNSTLQAEVIEALGNYGEYDEVEKKILPFLESDSVVLQEKAGKCLNKIRKTKIKTNREITPKTFE